MILRFIVSIPLWIAAVELFFISLGYAAYAVKQMSDPDDKKQSEVVAAAVLMLSPVLFSLSAGLGVLACLVIGQ